MRPCHDWFSFNSHWLTKWHAARLLKPISTEKRSVVGEFVAAV